MKILKALLSVVITLVVIVGGFMLYVNARYGINVVSVIKSLDKLSANVDVATIAPNAITDADYATTKTQLNSSLDNLILFNSETATYSITFPPDRDGRRMRESSSRRQRNLARISRCWVFAWGTRQFVRLSALR